MSQRDVRVVPVTSRRRRFVLMAAAGAVMIACMVGAYLLGLEHGGLVSLERATLREQLQAAQDRIAELEAARVDAEVAADVQRATADELREVLAQMHDEHARTAEEVTFYRSLMAPSSLERGLQQDLAGSFRYELLLTQVEARRSVVQGSVTVDVVGELAGDQAVLPLTELTDDSSYPLKYRFRYFQDFSGLLTLPEGFEPLRVVVTVTRQGSREANLQRTFNWQLEVG